MTSETNEALAEDDRFVKVIGMTKQEMHSLFQAQISEITEIASERGPSAPQSVPRPAGE